VHRALVKIDVLPAVSSRGRVRDQPLPHLTSRIEHGCSALRDTHR
jgi:hypothetical protein